MIRDNADEENINQICEISYESIENARRLIDKITKDFYDTFKLSKKDYEKRCRIETVSKTKLND